MEVDKTQAHILICEHADAMEGGWKVIDKLDESLYQINLHLNIVVTLFQLDIFVGEENDMKR